MKRYLLRLENQTIYFIQNGNFSQPKRFDATLTETDKLKHGFRIRNCELGVNGFWLFARFLKKQCSSLIMQRKISGVTGIMEYLF